MSTPTIKFRAGKVNYDPELKIATPDPIQGLITIKVSDEDDSFYSFVWEPKDSSAGNAEKEELLVIPGDVTWTHIKEVKDGRIFALKFLSSGARHLFWLQQTNDDDDPRVLSEKDKSVLKEIEKIFEPVEENEDEEVTDAQDSNETKAEDSKTE